MLENVSEKYTEKSYVSPIFSEQLRSIGLFALSGAFTNWLAVHMLFERVPGLYGSGIIVSRFKEFKISIYSLIMEQFFNTTSFDNFFNHSFKNIKEEKMFADIVDKLDYDLLYDKLVSALVESPLGSMLSLVGGVAVIEPAKPMVVKKLQQTLKEMVEDDSLSYMIQSKLEKTFNSKFFRSKVEVIIKNRLDELTPLMVKEMVQGIIQKHLGWLVVWGGVFGGLIGLIASIV